MLARGYPVRLTVPHFRPSLQHNVWQFAAAPGYSRPEQSRAEPEGCSRQPRQTHPINPSPQFEISNQREHEKTCYRRVLPVVHGPLDFCVRHVHFLRCLRRLSAVAFHCRKCISSALNENEIANFTMDEGSQVRQVRHMQWLWFLTLSVSVCVCVCVRFRHILHAQDQQLNPAQAAGQER